MALKNYKLNKQQQERLIKGVAATLVLPMLDSIEDFIWEAIFCFTKDIPLVDPLFNTRSKRLFDIVDKSKRIGWSAKAIQQNFSEGRTFEIVIQRSDVFSIGESLGFPGLNKNSNPNIIGAALLKHWHQKIINDAEAQGIDDKRICVLLKSPTYDRFAYLEEDLTIYKPDELDWRWTNDKKRGLQGIRKSDSRVVYRWYPSQKQFFERFLFTKDHFTFKLTPQRLPLKDVIDLLYNKL